MMAGGEAIGVDIGGTNLRVARVAPDGTVIDRRQRRHHGDPVDALKKIIALARTVDGPAVASIGIGAPGRVDSGDTPGALRRFPRSFPGRAGARSRTRSASR